MKLSIRFSQVSYGGMPVLCVDGKGAAYIEELELGMPASGGPDLVVTKMRVYAAQRMGVPMVEIPPHPAIEVVVIDRPLSL